jgi:uridine monophosphate synthetase
MTFFEALEHRAKHGDTLLCVGLDPRGTGPAAVRGECLRLIDATAEFACAFKPNSAFFEALGEEGPSVLRDVIAHVPGGIPVILDAKRGDIADTAEAYATAAFGRLGAQAITLSPYLGGEALTPFLRRSDRGAFVLCRTSNPGADEFQSLRVDDASLFEVVARRAVEWNARGNVGLVVGATDPEALARVRQAAPGLWFLVPGVGAQGGDLRAALEAGLRPDGLGMLINVSRGISRADDPGAEAKRIRDEINTARTALPGPRSPHPASALLARDLVASQCVRFGAFRLKSGSISPIYLDLRRLVTHPRILKRVARAYAETLRGLQFDRIAGIPYAALPIATVVALEMDRALVYPRREAKDYGTRAVIEGDHVAGETIVVIDDLATTGDSKLEAIRKLEEAGLQVRDIVVLIDRGQGAGPMLAEAGYRLHAVTSLPELLDEWLGLGAISPAQHDEVVAFLDAGRASHEDAGGTGVAP